MAVHVGQSLPLDAAARTAAADKRAATIRQTMVMAGVWAFILAGLVFMVLPGIWMILSSLKTRAEIVSVPLTLFPRAFQWVNYSTAIDAAHFGTAFRNSIIITVAVTVANVFTSTWGGFTFGKLRWPGRDKIFLVLLSTLMIPGFLTLIPRYLIVSKLHMLNSYQGMIVPFLAGAFGIFLVRQYMLGIPDELMDAARVDGASALGIYWKIMLPLCMPVVAVLAIFTFEAVWDDLLWGSIILTKREMWTLPITITNLRAQFGELVELQMAASTLAMLPVIIVFLVLQRHIIQGVALSGLKG